MIRQLVQVGALGWLIMAGGCLAILGGCNTLQGNGGYEMTWGTTVTFGHTTEKSDETQKASSSWDFAPLTDLILKLRANEDGAPNGS